jgi:hypothetical protein
MATASVRILGQWEPPVVFKLENCKRVDSLSNESMEILIDAWNEVLAGDEVACYMVKGSQQGQPKPIIDVSMFAYSVSHMRCSYIRFRIRVVRIFGFAYAMLVYANASCFSLT